MSALTFEDIRIAMDAGWVIEPKPKPEAFDFVGVAIDTRAIQPGQLFFAFVGEQVDGHDYLDNASKAGAGMCVVTDASKVPDGFDVPVLVVDDALDAITRLASAWRQRLKAKVIAITGSNGKTTTCQLVHSVCAQSGSSFVSQRSFNNALGVPITILNTPSDADYLIAEIGTSSPGEIGARGALVKPDIALITSIGRAHLEELGDQLGVAREKAQLISALPDGASAFIVGGIDDLESQIVSQSDRVKITRIGTEIPIEITEPGDQHTGFTVAGDAFTIPMLGGHNASNAAMAIMVGRTLGLDDAMIQRGLTEAKLPEMRFDRIEIPTKADPIVIYNDAYNANPDSMRAALQTFETLTTGSTRIAILGDMLELGEHRDDQHRAIVNELGHYPSIDRFVLVGQAFAQTPTQTPTPTPTDSDRVMCVESTDGYAMTQIARSIMPGSCVLLKGSRGIKLERIMYILINSIAAKPSPKRRQTNA